MSIPRLNRALGFLPFAGMLALAWVAPVSLPGQVHVWTGAISNQWSNPGNWTGGVPASGATATFNTNTANDPNLTAAAAVGRLLFLSGSDAEVFTGSALTLNGVSGVGIDNQSGLTQTFSNTLDVAANQAWNAVNGDLAFAGVTLRGNVTLTGASNFSFGGTLVNSGGNRTFTNNATGTVTLSGVNLSNNNAARTLTFGGTGNTLVGGIIANGGTGAGNLVKTGAGTLTLSGANTYTGTTTIGASNAAAGGTLRLGASDAISNNTVTVFGGTLDLNNNNDTIGALNLGGGAAGTSAQVTTGTGTLTLGGNITYNATNNPLGASIAGQLNLGTANRTITVNDSSAAGVDLSISANIAAANRNLIVTGAGNSAISGNIATGTGTLTKQGAGTLTLSGTNSYSGLTTVSAGVLNIQNSSALGTTAAGTTVATGAALQLQGNIAVGAEPLTIAGTGVGSTGALRNISGNNSWAGAVTLAANSMIESDAGTLTVSGGISGATRTLTVGGAGDTVLSGAITTTSGGLIKQDAGTLTLSGANTYTGATTISGGTLRLGASGVIADASAVTVAAGATFDVNGQVESIASLAGAGQVLIGTGQLISAGNASTVFSGQLAGTGSFTKQGTGILTLDSTTDFSFGGTLVLAGGTLRLSDLNLGLGALSITGNTTIDFAGTSSLSVGTFSIADGVTLNITNWSDGTDYFFATNWVGATPNVTGVAPMNQVAFTGFTSPNTTRWQSYDNQITPVPEPSTYGALLLLLSAGFLAWRRRRAG